MRNLSGPEELGEQGLPLAGGQLDMWLAQQTGRSDTEWQHSQFVVIEGTVKRLPRRQLRVMDPGLIGAVSVS